jgi:glycosyltransferase involved in cell wall biosynthesis
MVSGTRALHLVSSSDRRGAQVFATQLAGALGGPPDHPVVAISEGATANRLPMAELGHGRWDPLGIARLVAGTRRFDVLVAHGSSALLHSALASAFTGRPFVYRNIGDPASWGSVRGASLRIGAPLRRAAAVSALYPAARRHLVEAYDLAPERVTTIPNGVPDHPRPTEADRAAARDRFGLDDGLEWLAFVGALSEEKGILAAIEAVALDERLGLVVAGDGPQSGTARDLADRLAPRRVRFLGVVDDPVAVLAAADVVVMPSRTEGIPATAIEAGLSGRAVVASRVGGLPEVVEHAVTGMLIDDASPRSILQGVQQALDRREPLGTAARQRCLERFTMAAVAERWAELIDAVAQGRPAASCR